MRKIIFSLVILSTTLSFAQKNLIKNGGFEYYISNWDGDNTLIINPYTKHLGSKGGSITQYTSPTWKGISQEFNIPKNTLAIEVSAWLKVDGVVKGDKNWNQAILTVEIDGTGTNLASLDGTTGWKEYKKIVPLNNDRSGKLMIALSECTGTFYFDDISVTPVSQEELNKFTEEETRKHQVNVITDSTPLEVLKLSNDSFENGLENWRGDAAISTTEKFEGNKSLKLTSTNPVWTGIDQIADVPNDAKTIDISAYAKTVNLKQGPHDWSKGLMAVEFTKDGSTKSGEDQSVFLIGDVKDWQKFSKTLPIPKGVRRYRIMLALNEATGTMFVDDVQVKFNK